MFGLFDRQRREIGTVNKGVPEVIEYARQCFGAEVQRSIALATVEHLERAHATYDASPDGAKQAIAEYRRLHKEARQQRDDVSLTAFTLVMLYIRAEVQGEPCRKAVSAIDVFVAEWSEGTDSS